MGQTPTLSENTFKDQNHSLLRADGDPRGTAQFAKLVDQGSSKSMPKSRYDVPQFLMPDKTGREPGTARQRKVDGIFQGHRQVAEGCHLVKGGRDLC